jgi:hypothetical protein
MDGSNFISMVYNQFLSAPGAVLCPYLLSMEVQFSKCNSKHAYHSAWSQSLSLYFLKLSRWKYGLQAAAYSVNKSLFISNGIACYFTETYTPLQ